MEGSALRRIALLVDLSVANMPQISNRSHRVQNTAAGRITPDRIGRTDTTLHQIPSKLQVHCEDNIDDNVVQRATQRMRTESHKFAPILASIAPSRSEY